MKLAVVTEWAVVLAATTLLTGCATPALWAKKRYQPVEQPHLALGLAHDGRDLLVCYDEHCEKDAKAQRRAYWLFNYVATGKSAKPHFVDPAKCDALCSVAVSEVSPTKTKQGTAYCAVIDAEPRRFHLYKEGLLVGTYQLPIYQGAPPVTFWRLGLTPLAVATDGVIVAMVLFVAGAPGAAM